LESILFFISVFLAGVLSFFSPCIFPLLPVYAGVLLDDQEESKTFRFLGKEVAWSGLIRTLCFITGISLIFFILGFGAGFLGNLLYADWFRYVMGVIIIILGLHQMEILHLRKLEFQKTVTFNQKQSSKYLSAFLLGISFSFGWTPCIGPVLSSVLALAASGGLIMPYFSKIKSHLLLLKRIGGLLIILMGILLMLGQLNILSGILG